MTKSGHAMLVPFQFYPQVLRRGVYPTRTIGGSRGDRLLAYLTTTCTRVPLAAGVELSLSVSLALQLFKPVLGIDFIQGATNAPCAASTLFAATAVIRADRVDQRDSPGVSPCA
jgi:hypothetical protein